MSLTPRLPLCSYYHCSLNPKKLIEIKFSGLRRNEKLKDVIKRNRLPPVRGGGWVGRRLGAAAHYVSVWHCAFSVLSVAFFPSFPLSD